MQSSFVGGIHEFGCRKQCRLPDPARFVPHGAGPSQVLSIRVRRVQVLNTPSDGNVLRRIRYEVTGPRSRSDPNLQWPLQEVERLRLVHPNLHGSDQVLKDLIASQPNGKTGIGVLAHVHDRKRR
jgi:hypothetical protein